MDSITPWGVFMSNLLLVLVILSLWSLRTCFKRYKPISTRTEPVVGCWYQPDPIIAANPAKIEAKSHDGFHVISTVISTSLAPSHHEFHYLT